MKSPRSLTQRVVWALAGTVGVFVSALLVLAFMTFGRMEDDLVNEVVRHETSRLSIQLSTGDARLNAGEFVGLGDALRAWLIVEGVRPVTLPADLHDLVPGVHELDPGDEIWHVGVEDVPSGRLVVVYDATENEQRVYDFGLIVLLLGIMFVLAAYALARRLAKLVVAPLHTVTDRLVQWAPGAVRSGVSREDEAGRLIEAFDRAQQHVDRMMAAERQFSANLSHEIRTPLAAMRSDGEIMLLDTRLASGHRIRLERIVGNVDAVASALESARAVALDTPQAPSPVNLRDCLEDAWLGLSARAQAGGLGLLDMLPPDLVVVVDRHAIMSVMRNLIGNAIEHAAPATLTVGMRAGALYIEDDGPGIAPEDLPYVFERYFSSRRRDNQPTEGTGRAGRTVVDVTSVAGRVGTSSDSSTQRGLGLAIAKRVCDLHGWSLTACARDAGQRGVTFVLELS